MQTILLILIASFFVGCVPKDSSISVNFNKKNTATVVLSANVSSVQIINNQLVINGNGFNTVTNVKVNGTSFSEIFSIESKTATKIIANSIRAFSFDVSKVFSLILSDANASATFPIDFSLCNATLNGKGFNCAAPVADKDVLAYDAISGTWKPRPASGLNYLGTFDASTNPGSGPAIQPAGAYYIISDSGSIASVPFTHGDWLVSNGSAWQKIDNSTSVLSVFGRSGAITAQTGDYDLSMLGDISFPTAPVAGKVLKFDGTHWVAGDDLSGGGAGSVGTATIVDGAVTDAKITSVSASKITGTITSSQIADGTIVNADINAAAAIDYSKLNIPNTVIPYAKLNIADGDIPAAKISGLPSPTSVLTATITNGDTTHAPNGDAVYDALALKIGTTGGTLTVGTISGIPTPVGPSEAANKSYVDNAIAGVTGFTEAAVLGTDLAGLNTGVNGPITATDTVLGAFGKMQYQVTDLKAKGLWDKTVNDISYSAGNVSIDKKLRLKSDNANYVEILSPNALASTYVLTLPANDGNANQVLKTDGAGVLAWVDVADSSVQSFAKSALPTCGAGEVLKSNGTTFSCVTDNAGAGAFSGTGDRAVITTAGGALGVSATTATELSYVNGVTSSIQTQLNGKEPLLATGGTTAQYFRGDKSLATLNTAGVPELTNLYFTQARAIASPLTGVSSTAGTITAADTILGAFGKMVYAQGDYVSKSTNSTVLSELTISGTGSIVVPTPTLLTQAANMGYVQTYVDAAGRWSKGTGDDIYRSVGSVGIGTSSPDSKITVALGNNLSGPQRVMKMTVGGDASPIGGGLLTSSAEIGFQDEGFLGGSIPGAAMYFSHSVGDDLSPIGLPDGGHFIFKGTTTAKDISFVDGQVGIGTSSPKTALDVAGAVRVGSSSTCDVGTSGSIRYNTTLGSLEFCDGTIWRLASRDGLVPANSQLVMKTCPTGWTNIRSVSSPSSQCNGSICQVCQSPATPALIPPSTLMVMENCPFSWTNRGSLAPASTCGETQCQLCESPAASSSPLPVSARVLNGTTCPAEWVDTAPINGPSVTCGAVAGESCRVCEIPGGLNTPKVISAGSYSGTSVNASNVMIKGGASSTLAGIGGAVKLTGGQVTDGTGGAINILAGHGASATSVARAGGNVTITGGTGVFGGAGGTVTITAGTNDVPTPSAVVLQPSGGGSVGIGISTPNTSSILDIVNSGTTKSAIIVPRAAAFTGTATNGMIRYNSTSNLFEFYENGAWVNYTTVSDERLKTNITPMSKDQGLKIVNQLNPVFYDWDKTNPRTKSLGDQHQVGFIAQEVEKILPEVVNVGADGYRSVEYGKIVSVVVAAIKELYIKLIGGNEVDVIQSRQIASKADKTETAALRLENAQLKKENSEIKAYLCSKDPKATICK